MAILSAREIAKSFGSRPVLDGVSLSIQRGERLGLVGDNGCGKSTLGRILVGAQDADHGEVTRRRDASIGYLPQEPQLDATRTARELVARGLAQWAEFKARYDALTIALTDGDGDVEQLAADQAVVAEEIERHGGWDLEHRVEAMMEHLGVPDPEQLVGTMSGGEQRRVALAQLLLRAPTLAIFDEPTNHLDADTIEWFEQYLASEYPGAVLLITHDRYLLDRVVSRTLELTRGNLYSYDGGWEQYLVAKAERAAHEARTEANRQRFVAHELEWLRRQPKARTGKQKARIQRATTAQQVETTAERRSVELVASTTRAGKTILELEGLGVGVAGRTLIDRLDLKLTPGERIGVVGRNGSGKTSLLRTLRGEIEPVAGRVVLGKNTRLAYFDQTRSGLDDHRTIIENVADRSDTVFLGGRPLSVYTYLERFSFFGTQMRQPVGALSGGERARVALAKLLLDEANVLLLDEPSNDLDVSTLGALEDMLTQYRGCVIVVTHDRYFLDRVATSVLVLDGAGGATRYPGNYETYRRLRTEEEDRERAEKIEVVRNAPAARPTPSDTGQPKPLTYAEQLELDTLLDRVERAEAVVASFEAELADPELYATRGDRVPALRTELARARAELDALVSRWEALESRR